MCGLSAQVNLVMYATLIRHIINILSDLVCQMMGLGIFPGGGVNTDCFILPYQSNILQSINFMDNHIHIFFGSENTAFTNEI